MIPEPAYDAGMTKQVDHRMSNAETVRMYWQVCWNERRVDRLADVFHAEYLHGRRSSSPEGHAAIIEETVRSFPDLQVHIDDLEDLGDTIITRTRFVVTHGGEIFGLRATGRSIEGPSLDVYFFDRGRVRRLWHLFDHLPLIVAIGAEVRVGGELAQFD